MIFSHVLYQLSYLGSRNGNPRPEPGASGGKEAAYNREPAKLSSRPPAGATGTGRAVVCRRGRTGLVAPEANGHSLDMDRSHPFPLSATDV